MRKRAVWHRFIQRPICWTACLGLSQEVIPKLITQVLGNSGFICLMPSHCSTSCSSAVSLKLLRNISSTFLMSLIPPHGKTSFTFSCPPMYLPSFLICLIAKRQPMSRLKEARVSWPTSWLSSVPLPISFHQEGMKSLSLIPEQLIIKNLKPWNHQIWLKLATC